jgi:hypothetical protein
MASDINFIAITALFKGLEANNLTNETLVRWNSSFLYSTTNHEFSDTDAGTPVSVKIRERIKSARKRFNANDNISEFIQPGELELLLDEVESKMKGVLSSLVIDTDNDHNTDETARRVAKMYLKEVFQGRYVKAPCHHRVSRMPNTSTS